MAHSLKLWCWNLYFASLLGVTWSLAVVYRVIFQLIYNVYEISVTIELVHMYLLLIMKRNEGPKRIKRISISLVKQISHTRHPPDAQDTSLPVGYLVLDAMSVALGKGGKQFP